MTPTPTQVQHRDRYPAIVALAVRANERGGVGAANAALAELDKLIEDLEAAVADREHAEERLQDEVGEAERRADKAEDEAEKDREAKVAAERERDEARDALREALPVVAAAVRWQHNPTGFSTCSKLRSALAHAPTALLHEARYVR